MARVTSAYQTTQGNKKSSLVMVHVLRRGLGISNDQKLVKFVEISLVPGFLKSIPVPRVTGGLATIKKCKRGYCVYF